VECGLAEGLGTSPEKKILKMIFECILPQLTGRKHGRLGAWILQFNRKITKLTKHCKLIQKFTVRPGGGLTIAPPPEYATACPATTTTTTTTTFF